jgi:hypothetical protein
MFERLDDETKKELESACEQHIWLTIEGLGGVVWRMEHDLSDGRIESTPEIEEDLLKMREMSKFAARQISRFRAEVLDENGRPKKEYWDWYETWKEYVEELSDADFHELGKLAKEGTSPELDYMRPDPKELDRFDLIDLDD